ncbi:MAG: hypothetical protein B7Z55_14365 [Planctomycetales bacterium 12-60-4]|nr:MAG: hypothetical protein B7Z55_14365 [Planctomycetales bacterium 12-60-4]
MLVDRHRRRAMELCAELGLLKVIAPELYPSGGRQPPECGPDSETPTESENARIQGADAPRSVAALEWLENPAFELAFATLVHELPANNVETLCRQLKLSNHELDHITWLVAHRDDLLAAPTMSLAQLKRLLAHRCRDDLVRMSHARMLAADQKFRSRMFHPILFTEEFLSRTPREVLDPPPLISGAELIQLGLRPGPRFKELLDAVRDAQLNLEIVTREEALALVRQLQVGSGDGTP